MLLRIFMYKFLFGCVFISLKYMPRRGIGGSYGNSVFTPFWGTADCFPLSLHHFTFLPAVYETSSFPTSSATLVIVCLFDFSHPSGCEVVSHYSFDLHFTTG